MEYRRVSCVLSARSASYAEACLASLIRNVREPISLRLITDGPEDVRALEDVLERVDPLRSSQWRVHGKAEADALAESYFGRYPAISQFRNGHPCWRKITDPALFTRPGEEMIIIDPDVYFPNPFRYEETPAKGILLMWQRPNCLLPEEVVERAYEQGIALADHTDIGVCQARELDWDFLEDVLTRLGVEKLPAKSMHVESIIWAAFALHQGGGYLDPESWHCFANSVPRRIKRKLGCSGLQILHSVDLRRAKCFHAGGVAKNWLVEAEQTGKFASTRQLDAATPVRRYQAFGRSKFKRKFMVRRWAAKAGLYKLLAR